MLTIAITSAWLTVVMLVVGACRVAAFADDAVDELAFRRPSSRRAERRLKTEAANVGADVLLAPSQPT
jgi:hypothetical protein